jgi:hypothetical protein
MKMKILEELVRKAQDHAERAGTAALDVDVVARVGGAKAQGDIIATAAQAHAYAAQAYKEAALARAAFLATSGDNDNHEE